MWETLQNNADWDCFKTPILQEILRIQNLHLVEHYAFLEVTRSFQSVGCLRNKLQFRTAQQNLKSFPWMQAGLRLDGIPAFDLRDLIVTVLHGNAIKVNKYSHLHLQRERKFLDKLMIGIMLILFPQTRIFLVRKLCCMCLKTTKQ